MPAAYAHHRFGDACIAAMPKKYRSICKKYRSLFDLGVHGPDLLFYHKPLQSTAVNRYGSELHHRTGEEFFEVCRSVYREMPVEGERQRKLSASEKNALLAYMLGFLAHFTLDSFCHAYINRMAKESPYSHNLIESQYDAFLMRRDGRDPLRVDRSRTIIPSKKNAGIIALLFPFGEKEIYSAMKGQKTTLHLFYSPKSIKKNVLRKLIRSLNLKGNFDDLFLDREEIPGCVQISAEILERQRAATERYPELFENFLEYLKGKAQLKSEFHYDFEGEFREAEG